MTGIKYKDTGNLADVILPQNILVHDEKIFAFDRINMDEGRLYKFNENYTNKKMIMEVDEGECFFGKDNYVYILYAYENSLIEVYDLEGNKVREISLTGQVYFLDIDSYGNIYAVFSEGNRMYIRVYDFNGAYIRDMHSRNMPIISAVWADEEYTYIGGLCSNGSMRVEKVNCMSYIMDMYDINIKDSKLIPSKILKNSNTLFCILTGDNQDSIVAIDTLSGEKKRLEIDGDVKSIYDLEIKGNELLALCGRGKILAYHTGQNECSKDAYISNSKNSRSAGYGYLLFIVCVKNLWRDFISMLVRAGIPLAMIVMLYMEYRFKDAGMNAIGTERIRLFLILALSFDILGIISKNAAMYWKKRARVDNLLDIYNRIENIESQILNSSAFMGILSASTMLLLTYKRGRISTLTFVLPLAAGFISAVVLYGLCARCIKKLKDDIDHMVFELLNFDEKNHEIFKKIVREIKKIRRSGVEKYRIKVLTKSKIKESTLKLIKRWSTLRKKITGDPGKLEKSKEYLVFDLNLKNRDIRYSRISVIEDFICYIDRAANISSIIIESGEDEESMTC